MTKKQKKPSKNCPFWGMGGVCTYKQPLKAGNGRRAKCGYSNPSNCEDYENTQSKLKNAPEGLEIAYRPIPESIWDKIFRRKKK